jgi:hypothetical protein
MSPARALGERIEFHVTQMDRVQSSATTLDRRDWLAAGLLGTATVVLLITVSPLILRHGDAVQYAHLISENDFSRMTIHVGYYLLGALSFRLLPVSIDTSLSLANCLFGAMTVALVCLCGRVVSGRLAVGILAGAILLTNPLFVLESIYAEVYASHLFFVVLTLLAWLLGRPLLTGVAYAGAHLVSPSAVFVLPALVILRPDARALLRMGLVASAIILPVVAQHPGDYIGGLLFATGHPWVAGLAISKEAQELSQGFLAYVLFVVVGAAEDVRRGRVRFAFALFAMWAVTFVLGEKTYDVPVQLPVYACLAIMAGLGADALIVRHESMRREPIVRWIVLTLILSFVIPASSGMGKRMTIAMVAMTLTAIGCVVFLRRAETGRRTGLVATALIIAIGVNALGAANVVREENRRAFGLRRTVAYVDETAAPDYLVIAAYNEGMLFEHYVLGQLFTGRWLHPEWLLRDHGWGLRFQVQARQRWRETLAARREVWFIGLHYPELTTRLQDELRAAGYTVEEIVPGLRRARFSKDE